MASPVEFLEAPIPRPLLWVGVPIAALALIGVLVFLRFPYGEFAPLMSRVLSDATGGEVHVGDIEPALTIGGPGMAARDIRIVGAGRQRFDIDPLRVRPAWSSSWLSGEPALKIEAESAAGRVDGIAVLGNEPSWSGEIAEVDLARLPVLPSMGLTLSGTLTAAAELTLSELGATGPLSFDANSGRIEHAMLPVGIDYERISADLMLGGGAIVAVHNFDLEGPALSASVTGSVLRGREPGEPQLDLAVEIEIKNPLLRAAVQGVGVRVDGRGRSAFSVRGTPSAPRMR